MGARLILEVYLLNAPLKSWRQDGPGKGDGDDGLQQGEYPPAHRQGTGLPVGRRDLFKI